MMGLAAYLVAVEKDPRQTSLKLFRATLPKEGGKVPAPSLRQGRNWTAMLEHRPVEIGTLSGRFDIILMGSSAL
jgi:hypothetical protein